jgi:hypothetical protein
VDHYVGPGRIQHTFDRDRIRHVQRLVIEQDGIMPGEARYELGAELSARTRN